MLVNAITRKCNGRFVWKEKDLDWDDHNHKDSSNPRKGRFVWKEEDLDFDEKPNKDLNNKIQSYLTTSKVPAPLGHYTNPLQEPKDPKEGTIHNDDHMGMATHSNSFSNHHLNSIKDYKNTGIGDNINNINVPLRKKITPEEHLKEMDNPEPIANSMRNNINNLDHVTSYKLKQPATLYRGVHDTFNLSRAKPGKIFTDHGFTSTSLDPDKALIHLKKPKPRLFRIHAGPGTKGYHIDRHVPDDDDLHEKEFLLHRGTKFKVRGHSQSPHFHIVDLDVVGQHPRKIELAPNYKYKPEPEPEHERITDTTPINDPAVHLGKKISETSSGHHIHKAMDYPELGTGESSPTVTYRAYNPNTHLVDMMVKGKFTKHPDGSHLLSGLSLAGRSGGSLKAHQFYNHLINNHNMTLESDTAQSPGGMKVWKKLAEDPSIHVYGKNPHTDKIHNVTARQIQDPKYLQAMNMRLVAHKRQPKI